MSTFAPFFFFTNLQSNRRYRARIIYPQSIRSGGSFMSKAFKVLSTLLATAAFITPAGAKAQDIAGKWTVEYPRAVRNINGVVQPEDIGTALLTIETKGDSVMGSWLAQNTPNPTARTLRGTFKNGVINLIGDPVEATIRRGDGGIEETSTVRMFTYYEGTLKDGAIEGTFRGESADRSVQMPAVKWKAKR